MSIVELGQLFWIYMAGIPVEMLQWWGIWAKYHATVKAYI